MEDAEIWLDDGSESAAGTIIPVASPYQSEHESIYSNDSHTVQDDPMEASTYDSWEDDSYYDMSGLQDDFDGDDSVYETAILDTANELPTIDKTIVLPEIPEMSGEALEENNNDPNNNMDSIEADNGGDEKAVIATVPSNVDSMEEFSEIIERLNPSPRPGCSKDSLPVSQTDTSPYLEERTIANILHLISKIDHRSILSVMKKSPDVAITDVKIWDLVPENERFAYQRDIGCSIDSRMKSTSLDMEKPRKKIQSVNNVTIGTSDDSSADLVITTSKVKRGPAEDICTVGCKKSSSEPDVSISIPTIPPRPPLSIPKVASAFQTAQIPQAPRAQPIKIMKYQQTAVITKSSRNDETKERRTATVVTDAATVYRPNVQFPPVDLVIRSRPKIVTKSQIVHQTAPRGAIPKVCPVFSRHQPAATANIAQVSHCFNEQDIARQIQVVKEAQKRVRGDLLVMETKKLQQQTQPVRNKNPLAQTVPHAQQQQTQLQQQTRNKNPYTQMISHAQQQQVSNQKPPSQMIPRAQQQQQPRNKKSPQTILYEQQQQHNNDPQALEERTNPPMQQQEQQRQQPQNTKRAVCMDMYYKLRTIFPIIDPEYIKKLCPPEWGPGNRDAQLAPLIEHLLERGDSLPMMLVIPDEDNERRASGTNETSSNVDDIYETLIGIFPDADPHYLREFAEKNVTTPNAVKQFVETKLENRDYPTREQYMKRLKITEQQRQYTSGFEIKHFLTIIPDPFNHFMDPNRKCKHNTVAFEFLKTYFNKIRVNTISRVYTKAHYNLSQAVANLECIGGEMKTRRGSVEMPTEDILLLQEIAFIKYKKEINDYLENAKKQEETEFKMLKEQNFLIECQCCYDTECVPSKCSSCENGHSFCNSCVINGTNSKLGDGETRISCFMNCGSEFSLSTLQQVLAPTTFSILLKKRQAAEVIEAGLEGLVSCPFCHFASIPPEEDKVFKCLNPECTKESCRLCKELSHVPLRCDEVLKADKARRYIEEKMTEALARKCYKCQRAFFKEEGCNKITCPCGAIMCYLCDQPIKDYSHFRGQGSDAKNLCPLYSDTIRLDAVAVHKVAAKAQMEIMKLHPNVKVDTDKLLPAIPRPSHGPHTAVLNADELPRRAQRVLNLQPEPM